MKVIKLILGLFAISLLFANCEKDSLKLRIINFSNSDCKIKSFKNSEIESIKFKSINNMQLEVFHNNALFNCCPGKIFAECHIVGDTINIVENETENSCDCVCPYDLVYTIDNLMPKTYYIKLQNIYLVQLNFNSNIDTTLILNLKI
jgi:hypothetical protein